MSSADKSHRQPTRKRGRLWLGALAVTLAALAIASLIAPYIAPSPVPDFPAPRRSDLARPAAAPAVPEAETGDAAPAPQAAPQRQRRRGVPLDAAHGQAGDDYEVLSAEELAQISQAED